MAPTIPRPDIMRGLSILYPPEHGIIELVAIKKDGSLISARSNDREKMVDEIAKYDGREDTAAIYTTINRLDEDTFQRDGHVLTVDESLASGPRVNSSNVARVTGILFDIDPFRANGDKKDSTTESEHQAAIEAADFLKHKLSLVGWPEPVVGSSGNGAALRYMCDLPASEETTDLLSRMLKAANDMLPGELAAQVEVDASVFDLPRISKVFGTMTRKGPGTTERPHRRSYIISAPERLEPVKIDCLIKLAGTGKRQDDTCEPGPQREYDGKVEPLSEDAAERLQALFDADPDFKTELFTPAPVGKRSDAEFHLCCRLWEAAFSEAEICAIMDSSPQSKWLERGDSYRWDTIRKAVAKVEDSHQPGMKILPLKKDDIEAGEVGVCQITGAVKQMIKTKSVGEDGNETSSKFLAWVSDCAVYIHTETNAKDDGEFVFKGVGAVDKRAVEFTMPAGALSDHAKFKSALINAFGAENRVGKLTFEIVQQITMHPRRMQRVEVPTWRENIPLLPGVGLIENVEFKLSSKIPAAVYDGDLQKAKAVLRKLLKVHKFASILVAAILGAPAVARWHKKERFGVAIWGLTGTLKTSMALAAMATYGIGYLDGPELKAGKDGSTAVGAMEVFASAGFLPQLYDNHKAVNNRDTESYVGTIHAVLEGKEKVRGKKDGGVRDGRDFTCTPIITGEVRPQEASTTARIFNLNWTRPDANLLSEVQANAAILPVIGYHWLRFLAETDCVLGKEFEAFRSKKMQEFLGLHYVNPGRLATIYSLLVSTWELLENSPLGDVFAEAREGFKAALQEATAVQGAAVSEETEISRFLAALEELIASNPGLIQSENGKKTIMGAIIGKWMPEGLFLLPTETLNELMKIKAFNQQPTIDSITQALNEKELLIPGGKGKLLNRQRINGTRVYGWYIRVPSSKDTKGDGKGDGKNANNGQIVPFVPGVLPENESENFLSKKILDKEGEKKTSENMGDMGDKGDSSIVDRLVDSDSYSKIEIKSVPFGVPFNKNEGDRAINPDCGIVEPTPAKKASATTKEKVRIIKQDGYRTQIPSPDDPGKFIDHLYSCGEVVEQEHWKACDLIKRGIAEAQP